MASTTRGSHQAQAAREQRRQRAQVEARAWRVTETLPGTFRVVTTNGDYAVWYYQGPKRWACSCPDHAEPFGAARKLGIECKHILGVQASGLVDSDTNVPLSLLGPGQGDNDTLPQEHDYDKENVEMTSETPQRYLITRVKKGQTETGKAIVELYSKKLQYPVLRLFELDDLHAVGIDHNGLDGTETHCRFWAYYETSNKTNSRGNPYQDVLYLEPIGPVAATAQADDGDLDPNLVAEALEALTGEVRAIKALLLRLAGGDQAPAAPPASPAPANASPNGKASDERKSHIKKLLKALGYGDDPATQDAALAKAKLPKLGDMTATQAEEVIKRLQAAQSKAQAARASVASNNGRGQAVAGQGESSDV
jgi:hypothetical protein